MFEEWIGFALVVTSTMLAGAICFGFGFIHGRRSAEREVVIDRYYQGRLSFEPYVPEERERDWAQDETYYRLSGRSVRDE